MAKKGKGKGKSQKAVTVETPTVEESESVSPIGENNEVSVICETEVNEESVQKEEEMDVNKPIESKPKLDNNANSAEIDSLKQRIKELELELKAKTSTPIENSHDDLTKQLNEKTQEAKHLKDNYNNLLSKVSAMKSLFTKMKATETELEESKKSLEVNRKEKEHYKSEVETLKSSIENLKGELGNVNSECQKLQDENVQMKKKISIKSDEYDVDLKQLQISKKKLEMELRESKDNLEEYLILLQEEKVSKNSLTLEINELKSKNEKCNSENKNLLDKHNLMEETIQQLKDQVACAIKEKKDIQTQFDFQIESKLTQISKLDEEMSSMRIQLDEKDEELKTKLGLEEDLKQKQLQIGKLRHENIKTNEHLSKAMKLLKRSSNAETVDRELISNLFINFLQLDRGDSKKFEVLQLISSFLDWDDEKRCHAGLMSGGNSGSRSKSHSIIDLPSGKSSQSFVSLWTEFLEKESTPQGQV